MSLKVFVRIWILLTILFCYEFYALNFDPNASLLRELQSSGGAEFLKGLDLSPSPGRPISLYLGWAGLGIMFLTNFYVVRKRFGLWRSLGQMSGWMNFHIFCGLFGPTLIVLHCNFKVHGLVAISFWSMVISVASGVVGRYFYLQVLGRQAELDQAAELAAQKLQGMQKSRALGAVSEANLEEIKALAVRFVGGPKVGGHEPGLISGFMASFLGDLRLKFGFSKISPEMGPQARALLLDYALNRRRSYLFIPFQRILGYWHAFHKPFAVFMYVVAVIHIAAALLFGVNR